tara:strand:- start:19398 stop:19805 length:408 start_codon:yes stop_codon:yes gene_type:complete
MVLGLLKGAFNLLGGGIAKDILGGVSDHFKAKRELKAAQANNELEIEKIRAKSISKQDTADIDKNLMRVQQQDGSWKDEFWTIIFGGMFISAFFWPERLQAGLAVLAGMDDNMQYIMTAVILTAFGVGLVNKLRR